jgi:soluble lytic murein transglycosylase-like protein
MKLFLAALLVAGSLFVTGSALISCLRGFQRFELSSNNFAAHRIGSVIHALGFTSWARTISPPHDTVTSWPEEATSQEKPAFPTFSEILALIREAANKYGVSPAFVKSIVAAESNFNCDAVSPKGAIGLMQLMPQTAREYGADPTVPGQNIEAGTHYLSVLMQKYRRSRNPLIATIAAYNAGPAAVDHHHGVPPFHETRGYVLRVLGFLRQFQRDGR